MAHAQSIPGHTKFWPMLFAAFVQLVQLLIQFFFFCSRHSFHSFQCEKIHAKLCLIKNCAQDFPFKFTFSASNHSKLFIMRWIFTRMFGVTLCRKKKIKKSCEKSLLVSDFVFPAAQVCRHRQLTVAGWTVRHIGRMKVFTDFAANVFPWRLSFEKLNQHQNRSLRIWK